MDTTNQMGSYTNFTNLNGKNNYNYIYRNVNVSSKRKEQIQRRKGKPKPNLQLDLLNLSGYSYLPNLLKSIPARQNKKARKKTQSCS